MFHRDQILCFKMRGKQFFSSCTSIIIHAISFLHAIKGLCCSCNLFAGAIKTCSSSSCDQHAKRILEKAKIIGFSLTKKIELINLVKEGKARTRVWIGSLLILKFICKKCDDIWNLANSHLTLIFPALAKLKNCYKICHIESSIFPVIRNFQL